MQQNKDKKQQYLREQILEPGYDVEDFIEYLGTYELGNDIDQISFKQLKQIVQTYCKKKAQEALSTTRTCKQFGFDQNSILKEQKKQTAKQIKYEKYGLAEPQLKKVFKCKKIKSEKQLDQLPKIQVNAPQRKSIGGFFGIGKTSFWAFQIITYQKKWKVKRRYSDFIWLRSMLHKFFPTYIIPPLPTKKASRKTTRDIEKRMRILSYFLTDVASVPQMFSSKFVQGFMSIDNDSQFSKLKKQGTNAQAFESIVSLETPSGQVTVSLSEQQKIFHEQFLTFATSSEKIYKQINKHARDLQNHILQETNTLYTMGNLFADLHANLKTFNVKLPQLAQNSLSSTYVRLNNMMIEWGNIVKNQHSFIQKSFLPFFRYNRYQLYSYKQLSARVVQFEQDYFKARLALEKRKQKLFHQNDIGKWQIRPSDLASVPATATKNKAQAFEYMLPKQTFDLDKLRLNYAFYSSQFQDRSEDLLQHGSLRFNQNFKEFAINIKVNTQQLAELWTEVATNFADPHRKLELMRTQINQSQVKEDKYQQDYQQN